MYGMKAKVATRGDEKTMVTLHLTMMYKQWRTPGGRGRLLNILEYNGILF